LIIDDGSSDNTLELVKEWKIENKLEIVYIFQENQGMHGAYNTAYSVTQTELITCIDSDDFMPEGAVYKIIDFWKRNGSDKFAGLIGLDQTIDGEILGGKFPANLKSSTVEDITNKYRLVGDKKMVYRTEIVRSFPPYPLFSGENFVPHGALFIQIDKHYELLCLNEVLCVVEYMLDGSTRNMFKQYVKYPQGFRYSRLINIKYSKYPKVILKNIIHLIACNIQLGDINLFKQNKRPVLTLILVPFGFVLYCYIKIKASSKV